MSWCHIEKVIGWHIYLCLSFIYIVVHLPVIIWMKDQMKYSGSHTDRSYLTSYYIIIIIIFYFYYYIMWTHSLLWLTLLVSCFESVFYWLRAILLLYVTMHIFLSDRFWRNEIWILLWMDLVGIFNLLFLIGIILTSFGSTEPCAGWSHSNAEDVMSDKLF